MSPEMREIKLKELHFDPENPRLPMHLRYAPEDEVLDYLLLECNLIELMLSIGQQGFFIGEPLLVVKKDDGYIVVEGNRRLGALKLLQKSAVSNVKPAQVRRVQDESTIQPDLIPSLIFEKREEILTYLGYRHITGIQPWDALAKARYLRQLRTRIPNEHAEAHKILAKEIGSKAPTVAKLLTGLTLIDKARDLGILSELKLKEEEIPFSLLTTGIGYENICRFIGIENSSDVEANNINESNFKEFLTWAFVKNSGSATVLGESRNFDKLARIVGNDQALKELRRGTPIEAADLYTSGPLEAVRKLMLEAEHRINSAQAGLSYADGFDSNDVIQSERLKRASAALFGALNNLVNPVD